MPIAVTPDTLGDGRPTTIAKTWAFGVLAEASASSSRLWRGRERLKTCNTPQMAGTGPTPCIGIGARAGVPAAQAPCPTSSVVMWSS